MKMTDFSFKTETKVFFVVVVLCFSAFSSFAQKPVIVQPGAPGQPSKILPADTKGVLPPHSAKDVEFMQGMIHHHSQAVEMTALIESRTQNKAVRLLGAKISQSQTDEMNFMKRWLEIRGEKTEMEGMHATDDSKHKNHLMPGMLTPKEMERLKNAKGAEFDKLFLEGMIRHHEGALVMVKELFAAAGTSQDAELFNFASDVNTGQKAEIRIMQAILDKKSNEEK